jgi:transcriptional regulator with XRE-family HTH domain
MRKTMDVSARVGLNLRTYRFFQRLGQLHISDRMADTHPTWSRATVSEVERGRRAVTVDELRDLAVILDVQMTDLLRESWPERTNS